MVGLDHLMMGWDHISDWLYGSLWLAEVIFVIG
jgi:hypothetical protein